MIFNRALKEGGRTKLNNSAKSSASMPYNTKKREFLKGLPSFPMCTPSLAATVMGEIAGPDRILCPRQWEPGDLQTASLYTAYVATLSMYDMV